MLMTHRQPFANWWGEMSRLHDDMNRLFDSFGLPGSSGWPELAGGYPALNLWEDADNVYAEAELPGMGLDDLEIYVTGGNQLSIKGERKQPELKQGAWSRQERGFGPFTRLVSLPVNVDADKVEARLQSGVLTVTMPKSAQARPRKITVKAE